MILKSLADLKKTLQANTLPALFIIACEDDYRRNQCRDLVFKKLQQQHGEIDCCKHFVNANFKWDALLQNNAQASLFASFNLVECYNVDNKFPRPAGKTLTQWIESSDPSSILVLYCSKLTNAQMNTAWGKLCGSEGAIMRLWPIGPEQMPAWIMERAKQLQLQLHRDAALLLASATEGNLLATEQCLQKLQVCNDNNIVNEADIKPLLAVSTSFGTFDWIDAALAGHAKRANKIFKQLQSAKQEPLMMLGAMLKTIREATEIAELSDHAAVDAALRKFWPSRRQLIQTALRRLDLQQWYKLLQNAMQIDKALKGRSNLDADAAWLLLGDLGLAISGAKTVDVDYA
jgi:DNA polymerase III subunit delta